MRFLLGETSTTEHRIEIGSDGITLLQQSKFEISNDATATLEWFLQKVKSDPSTRHTYTDKDGYLDFDPAGSEREAFCISRRGSGSQITMSSATMFKLLDALEGKTEGLEEEED